MAVATEYTYEKRLGHTNPKRFEPIVEASGEAWYTRNGVIVVYPDQWESEDFSEEGSIKPLPEGDFETVRMS